MLEDFTMEKKSSNRSIQTPLKGCGTEVKKAQDIANNAGKSFPRQSRRREPPAIKGDPTKKSFSQKQNKSACYDAKRPKPRGQLYLGCGKANTQVVDELTEQFGLVSTSPNGGSKKRCLNHLLNFHYSPRGEHHGLSFSTHHWQHGSVCDRGSHGHGYYNNSSARWLMSTHKHKYNKEQFLQANCQFVVRSDGDYTSYLKNPDLLVDWELIEQVRVFSCEDVNCPICLSTPVAGRITRCGHVFCWSCMLHYLALSDKSWRKCPICFESVHLQDLKSVLVCLRSTHLVGKNVTFQLMKREKGSLIASPVSQYDARTLNNLLPINENKLDIIHSKLLTASVDQVLEIIKKEKLELDALVAENEGCPELCFIEQAVQLLEERKKSLATRLNVDESNRRQRTNGNEIQPSSLLSDLALYEQSPGVEHDVFDWNLPFDKYFNEEVPSTKNASSSFARSHGSDFQTIDSIDNLTAFPESNQCSRESDGDKYKKELIGTELAAIVGDSNDNCKMNSQNGRSDGEDRQLLAVSGYGDPDGHLEYKENNISAERCRYISASSTSESEEQHLTAITAEDLEISTSANSATAVKHFYFYQALDGQQLYLHAVNVRMLEMTYGSLENCPHEITGLILEKESGSMTEELRKRLRYLQHLPVTCQFEVAEINLKPPVITADTLEYFHDQLESRRRRREKRARDERRREKKMVELVHRQYGRGPVPQLRIESLHHFPQCGSELSLPPAVSPIPSSQVSPVSSRASSPVSAVSSSSLASSLHNLSFAQMLREGKSTGGGWDSNPKRQHSVSSSISTARPDSQHDGDNDYNSSGAPHYNQSFRDSIATALEQAVLMHDKDEPEVNCGKKKKRKQKVLLFATGLACNNK